MTNTCYNFKMNTSSIKPKIFYDAKCIVCDTEINLYKKTDTDNVFEYVDISSQNFDPSSVPVDVDYLNKYFHVQLSTGEYVKGVDAFMEIWKKLPKWQLLEKVTNNFVVRPILKIGYFGFIYIRPYLPRRSECEDDYCSR